MIPMNVINVYSSSIYMIALLNISYSLLIRLLPGMISIFPHEMKSIRPTVSEEFGNIQTNKQTDEKSDKV